MEGGKKIQRVYRNKEVQVEVEVEEEEREKRKRRKRREGGRDGEAGPKRRKETGSTEKKERTRAKRKGTGAKLEAGKRLFPSLQAFKRHIVTLFR